MSAEHDFLRAICDEPGDDTRRLAFADWLDEHGEHERAEFIRVQVEQAWLPSFDPDDECKVCGNRPDEAGARRNPDR